MPGGMYRTNPPVKVVRTTRETTGPTNFLDPDIALWPTTVVQRWPFTGSPTEGVWPLGWLGMDDTATFYKCIEGGSPGTWAVVRGGGSGGYASLTGAGETATPGDLTQAGGFTVNDTAGDGIELESTGGGISITNTESGAINIVDSGDTGFNIQETGDGNALNLVSSGTAGEVSINASDAAGQVSVNAGGTSVTVNESELLVAPSHSSLQFIVAGSGVSVVLNTPGNQFTLSGLPTTDPHIVDAVWNNSGVLTLSAG
jgi:hypothetical protein